MSFPLEYHDVVNSSVTRSPRHWIPLSLALFGMCFVPLLISAGSAQISTSGGSGHSGSVSPPTATSVAPPTALTVAPPTGVSSGRSGFTPAASGFTHPTTVSHFPNGSHGNGNGRHHPSHTANGTPYYPYVYALPIPYAVDASDADASNDDSDDDAEYQGGPTIFDRRGSGPESYIPPSSPGPAHSQDALPEDASAAPEPQQPSTSLVFKDGHQLEVSNYAIVSQTLFDLTPGHPRKIALADLDLTATQKQNDDHGVVFQLPPSPQAN
jgi:hypothetical protein